MKQIILFIMVLASYSHDPEELFYAQRIYNLQSQYQCQSPSPLNQLQYGAKQVHQVKGFFFCDQYAKRTCCTEQNFNNVTLKWHYEYSQALNLSPACQESFQKIACHDCDGDIGQRLREGFCSSFCQKLFKDCYTDLFQYDKKTQKLRFCRKNDIICSEARDIFRNNNDTNSFCKAIGLQINEENASHDWADNYLLDSINKYPACWDGTPSQRVFGKAIDLNDLK